MGREPGEGWERSYAILRCLPRWFEYLVSSVVGWRDCRNKVKKHVGISCGVRYNLVYHTSGNLPSYNKKEHDILIHMNCTMPCRSCRWYLTQQSSTAGLCLIEMLNYQFYACTWKYVKFFHLTFVIVLNTWLSDRQVQSGRKLGKGSGTCFFVAVKKKKKSLAIHSIILEMSLFPSVCLCLKNMLSNVENDMTTYFVLWWWGNYTGVKLIYLELLAHIYMVQKLQTILLPHYSVE